MTDNAVLDDPTRVCGVAAQLLASMLSDKRPGYAWAAREALYGLRRGTLVGIQSSWSRFWLTLHEYRARPARCEQGALFQAMRGRGAPGAVDEWIGWIVLQNDFRSGRLVLVHELGHWLQRSVVQERAAEPHDVSDSSLVVGIADAAVRRTRAQFVNELGARHLAWLSESGTLPGVTRMPEPGALFACAVKIASYPEVYNDCGVMKRLLDRQDDAALRDQVGAWMRGLAGFRFFEPGREAWSAHEQWLRQELAVAAEGARAPLVAAEGTL